MAEMQLTLTDEESRYLVELLEDTLKATLVEEHRTRVLAYREHVVRHEELITNLLRKLGRPAAYGGCRVPAIRAARYRLVAGPSVCRWVAQRANCRRARSSGCRGCRRR